MHLEIGDRGIEDDKNDEDDENENHKYLAAGSSSGWIRGGLQHGI